MATLVNQLLSIFILVASSILTAQRVGDDESCIGHWLRIDRLDQAQQDFRAAAMARLNLSTDEKDSLLA